MKILKILNIRILLSDLTGLAQSRSEKSNEDQMLLKPKLIYAIKTQLQAPKALGLWVPYVFFMA